MWYLSSRMKTGFYSLQLLFSFSSIRWDMGQGVSLDGLPMGHDLEFGRQLLGVTFLVR